MLLAVLLLAAGCQDPLPLRTGEWRALGPFRASAAPATTQRLPLESTLSAMKVDEPWTALLQEHEGLDGRKLRWRAVDAVGLGGPVEADGATPVERMLDGRVIDLAAVLREDLQGAAPDSVAALLHLPIYAPEAQELAVRCGSDGGMKLWLNGRTILRDDRGGAFNVHQHSATLPLEAGLNHLVVKVVIPRGPWRFALERDLSVRATDAAVNRAIDRGVAYLLARQLPDGSWPDYAQGYPAASAALASYTLLKCGLPPDHPAVQRGLQHVRRQSPPDTYTVALVLMALSAAGDERDHPQIRMLADELVTWQRPNGLWAYPSGGGDLSNTQYAALGLRAAASTGFEVEDKVWEKLAAAVRGCEASGGFGYTLQGNAPSASMTAAGVGTLAICAERLGAPARDALLRLLDAPLDWLGRHCILHSDTPRIDVWSYYAIYGLERAGALVGVESFGGHEWYPEGARVLLRDQAANGGWHDGKTALGPDLNTCFALLFLRRATARTAITPSEGAAEDGDFLRSAVGAGALLMRVSLRAPRRMWIDRSSPAFDDLQRVVYWLLPPDGEWFRVEGEDGAVYAARQDFDRPGTWQLRASGFLADGSSVASGIIEVEVDGSGRSALPAEEEEAMLRLLRQLAERRRDGRPLGQVSASSARPRHAAPLAVDTQLDSGWRCHEQDARPEYSLLLRAPRKVSRLRVFHPPMRLDEALPRPLIARLRVRTGENMEHFLELPADPLQPGVLLFDPPVRLQGLELHVLELHHGALGAASVGIGELVLD